MAGWRAGLLVGGLSKVEFWKVRGGGLEVVAGSVVEEVDWVEAVVCGRGEGAVACVEVVTRLETAGAAACRVVGPWGCLVEIGAGACCFVAGVDFFWLGPG